MKKMLVGLAGLLALIEKGGKKKKGEEKGCSGGWGIAWRRGRSPRVLGIPFHKIFPNHMRGKEKKGGKRGALP